MRKLFLGLAALMLSMTVLAERVSQEDAALVANNFMNVGNTVSGVQKAPAKKMVLKKAATASENQYYVYENANGEGWVMVAANDVAHPILAYSNTGTFRTDNQPANLKVWLRGYDRQITRAAQDENYVANEQVQNEWKTLRKGANPVKAAVVVSPLIKTGWDQDSPYWNSCPQKSGSRCYTGCVATAMAQVMNYHQWPKNGTGSHTIKGTSYSANFGSTTYDWENMLNSYSGSSTSAQKTAVATLMYHCGVAVDMSYGTAAEGGSGAYTIDYNGYWSSHGTMCAETALTQFFGYKSSTIKGYYRDGSPEDGMKSWTKAEWIAMLKEELDAQRPIMYAGAGYEDPSDPDTGYGHSFVCDGYDSSDKFHFNWGWSNSCDGYYDVDALEPSEPGSGGGNGEYNLEQDVIIGIVPDKKDLPMITITWSVDGDETTSEIMQEDPLVLPANPANCENGKVFVGWTAESEVSGDAPADLFTTAGSKTVTEAITYYAVFATAEGGSAPVNTTLTMEDYATPDGTFGAFTFTAGGSGTSAAYNATGKDARYYTGNTLTISAETEMTKIVFNISAQGKKRLAPITASTGTIATQASGDTKVTWTGSATSVTFTVGAKADYGTEPDKAGQLDFTSVDITAGGGATYSDYSLTCSGVTPEPVYYNIRFFNNGNQIGETQSVLKNQQAEVPTGITAECEDYTFVGWWTAELLAENTEAKSWVTNFKATQDQDYYAIFSKTEEGQGGAAEEETTYTFTSKAWADATNSWTSNADGNQYNNDNQGVQVTTGTTGAGAEAKNSLDNVSKVVIKYCTNATKGVGSITVTVGTAELSKDVTKTGGTELRDLEFAFDNKSGKVSFKVECTTNSIYVNSVTITAGGGTSSTTYYSSVVTCGETAIDNNVVAPKAIKVLENGQIVIILGDQKYTIFGQKIQ
ncbi:MAG: C10 family peptidase [Paludibacteraceae bacterium]|nr:C10 family peptidase [Paludibacteraceae bacterium]